MSFEESPHLNYTADTTQYGSDGPNHVIQTVKTAKTLELDIDLNLTPELTKEEKIEIAYEQIKRDEALLKVGYFDDRTNEYDLTTSGERSRNSGFVVNQSGHVYKRILSELDRLNNGLEAEDMRAEYKLVQLLSRVFDSTERDEMAKLAAFIATQNVIQGTQIGLANTPPERTIVRRIGQQITFEAFIANLRDHHPRLVSLLARNQLSDPSTGTSRRIKIVYKKIGEVVPDTFEWPPFTDSDILKIGNFLANCVYDGCYVETKSQRLPSGKPARLPVFETIHVPTAKGTREKAIVLTKEGKTLLEEMTEHIFQQTYAIPPMLYPPKPWSLTTAGGYYTSQPEPLSSLVHNSAGTIPSENAISALNNLQSIPWQINRYIFNVLCELSKEHIEVGSFRSFNAEAYRILTDPNISPDDEALPWDQALTEEEVLRRNRAYAIRKQWELDEDKRKAVAVTPERVLSAAAAIMEDLEDYGLDCFFVPWFMDNRTRMYPAVDTLSPQGSDFQKALLLFKEGSPKSDASYRDILISIATTYGNGVDKLSLDERMDWAKQFVAKISDDFHPILNVVDDPLSEASRSIWFEADEPFQFLSLCKEYVDVFIRCTQQTHHVSSGRDATCSGIQITGALLRDQRTCELVNVLPSPNNRPQDAYAAVAEEAVKLLSDDAWLFQKVKKREEARKLRADKELKAWEAEEGRVESLRPQPYTPRSFEETKAAIPLDQIDRSVAKMVVMLTPYGGTFPTMLEHVRKQLQKKGIKLPGPDYTVITHALMEGMTVALRAFGEVNSWFKTLAKAAIASKKDSADVSIVWETPNGSVIRQEYYPEDANTVRTFTNEAGVVRSYNSKRTNYDKLNRRKMQTALAANVVHSLDANIIQDAICDYEGRAFTAVHDCIYGPSGTLSELTDRIKAAFYNTTVSSDPLGRMLELNLPEEESRQELPILQYGDAEISMEALSNSSYLFS